MHVVPNSAQGPMHGRARTPCPKRPGLRRAGLRRASQGTPHSTPQHAAGARTGHSHMHALVCAGAWSGQAGCAHACTCLCARVCKPITRCRRRTCKAEGTPVRRACQRARPHAPITHTHARAPICHTRLQRAANRDAQRQVHLVLRRHHHSSYVLARVAGNW